jgi:hypothetical protein
VDEDVVEPGEVETYLKIHDGGHLEAVALQEEVERDIEAWTRRVEEVVLVRRRLVA